jgi:hypothetical protein
MLDRKTSERVDFLFAIRAKRVAKHYINEKIIPTPSSTVTGGVAGSTFAQAAQAAGPQAALASAAASLALLFCDRAAAPERLLQARKGGQVMLAEIGLATMDVPPSPRRPESRYRVTRQRRRCPRLNQPRRPAPRAHRPPRPPIYSRPATESSTSSPSWLHSSLGRPYK